MISSNEYSVVRGLLLLLLESDDDRVCHCLPVRRVSDSPSSTWINHWSDEFEEKGWPRHSAEDD